MFFGFHFSLLNILFLTLALAATNADAQHVGDQDAQIDRELDQFIEIINLVQEHHVLPPTKQELVHRCLYGTYVALKRLPPGDLSNRISELTEDKQFKKLLREQVISDAPDKIVPMRMLGLMRESLLDVIPGQTRIIDAKNAAVGQSLAENRYVGIGIQLTQNGSLATLVRVIPGGTAYKAGLIKGDKILSVDGWQVSESENLGELVQRLRGPEGSFVELVVQQGDEPKREVKIERAVTFIATINGIEELSSGEQRYQLTSDDKIAYLRFVQIGPSTPHELRKIAAKLRGTGVEELILDMRSGGGLLHETILISDQLLGVGTIGFTQDRNGISKHKSKDGELFDGILLRVMISNQSGIGQLLLARALRDNRRAIIDGEFPASIGFVKKHVPLSDGGKLQLATAVLRSKDGTLFSNVGLRTSFDSILQSQHSKSLWNSIKLPYEVAKSARNAKSAVELAPEVQREINDGMSSQSN